MYGTPLFLLIAVSSFYLFGLHRGIWSYTSVPDLIVVVKASTCAVVVLYSIIFVADRLEGVPRAVPVIHWFVLVAMLSGPRLLFRLTGPRARPRRSLAGPVAVTPVLLCGCGPLASLFVRAVQSTPGTDLQIVGIIDDLGHYQGRCINGVPVIGHARDLEPLLTELGIHGIHPQRLVVAGTADELPAAVRAKIEAVAPRYGLRVEHLPDLFGLRTGAAAGAPWAGGGPARAYFRFRRLIDVVVSAAALLVLLPLIAVIAALVLLDVGPPVLFRQVRPGRHMRPFTLYKFRTMRRIIGADGAPLGDGERTSALGHLLRRTRLDELPQLYNVLVGDMSFIGPRPLLPRDLPEQVAERAAVRPGITGWAQVNGGHQLSAAEKMALDTWYVRNAGPRLDARIVYLTLHMMLFGERVNRKEIERAMPPA
jgi:lipopolysaccharide/colanic/teichoic acid biosynthesis glycosyltransferase